MDQKSLQLIFFQKKKRITKKREVKLRKQSMISRREIIIGLRPINGCIASEGGNAKQLLRFFCFTTKGRKTIAINDCLSWFFFF